MRKPVSGWKQIVESKDSLMSLCLPCERESQKATKGTCKLVRRIRRNSKREKAFSVKASTLATAARHKRLSWGIIRNYRHLFFTQLAPTILSIVHQLPIVSVESNTELLPLLQAVMVDKKQKEFLDHCWIWPFFSCADKDLGFLWCIL